MAIGSTVVPDVYYEVRYRTAEIWNEDTGILDQGPGSWIVHPEQVKGTSVVLEGLKPHTTYEVQVRTVNEAGHSEWTDSSVITTQEEEKVP